MDALITVVAVKTLQANWLNTWLTIGLFETVVVRETHTGSSQVVIKLLQNRWYRSCEISCSSEESGCNFSRKFNFVSRELPSLCKVYYIWVYTLLYPAIV